jgi:hypothetical protein
LHFLAVQIVARRDPEQVCEPACQMTLIAESQLSGNLRDRLPLSQETLGLSNSHTLQVGVRGHAHLPFKDAMDIVRTEPDQQSQLSQRDRLGKVLVEVVAYLLDCRPFLSNGWLRRTDFRIPGDEQSAHLQETRFPFERSTIGSEGEMEVAQASGHFPIVNHRCREERYALLASSDI